VEKGMVIPGKGATAGTTAITEAVAAEEEGTIRDRLETGDERLEGREIINILRSQ